MSAICNIFSGTAQSSYTTKIFFSIRCLGVLIFWLKPEDSVLWLPEGNPLSLTPSTQAGPSTFLSCMTSFELLGGWEGPQPLLPHVRASSIWPEPPQQKPVEHQSRNFHTASHHPQRPKETTQCSQGTSADLLSWAGKGERRSLLSASYKNGWGAAAHWWSPVLWVWQNQIHTPSSSLPVPPASDSLLSVMWIFFTSLISFCHQLMNKLFISKFINYSTNSIDDWILLTK